MFLGNISYFISEIYFVQKTAHIFSPPKKTFTPIVQVSLICINTPLYRL